MQKHNLKKKKKNGWYVTFSYKPKQEHGWGLGHSNHVFWDTVVLRVEYSMQYIL